MNKTALITMLFNILMEVVTEDRIKDLADYILDLAEDAIAKSDNKIDDVVIGGMIKMIRETFDIEDGDD